MAADVQIIEKNGAGGTGTNKTSGTIRFKNADNATVDLNNPMVVPGAGSDWSYEKWLRTNFNSAPSGQITNLDVYSDGSSGFGTGISTWIKAVTSYSTPAEGTSSSGYADFFGKTSGSPLSLGAGPFTSTGEKGDHAVMLVEVASTASQGVLSSETFTLRYDEI